MSANTVSTLDGIFKEHYTSKKVAELVYRNNPWYALCPKYEEFAGDQMPVPVIFGAGQGRSHDFATAQALASKVQNTKFVVTLGADYQVDTISGQALRQAEKDMATFVRAKELVFNLGLQNLARNLALEMFGNGGGARGQVGAITTTTVTNDTITLLETEDVRNFELNMEIQASDADGTSGSLRDSGDSVTIVAIDRSAGTIRSDQNTSSIINGLVVNDYIFQKGDFGVALKGLRKWCPLTAPTSGDSLYSVDRSVDTVRLAGNRYNASSNGDTIEEGLVNGCSVLAAEGATPRYAFLHHSDMRQLVSALGSKVQYNRDPIKAKGGKEEIATIGFGGVEIDTDGGKVTCIADRNQKAGYADIVDDEAFELASAGPAVGFLMDDGLKMLRQSSVDGYEVRMGGYAAFLSRNPSGACVVTLGT